MRRPGGEGRRRRHGPARLDRRRVSHRLDHRHASRRRAPRRVRAQPLSARSEAGDAAARTRVQVMHDGHDGDAQPTRATRRAVLPARADLAHRVRLPEQPARSDPRRHARTAGALRLRGRIRRVPRTPRRHAHPLLVPRRADPRAVPERPRHAQQHTAAGARRVRAAARRDRPLGLDDESLGPAARARRRVDRVLERRWTARGSRSRESVRAPAATSAGGARFHAEPSSESTRAASSARR